MKTFISFSLGLLILCTVTACQEDQEASLSSDKVTYEVITTSGNWYGEYITESGEKDCICSQPLASSGWTYTFQTTSKPFELHIDATTECCADQADAPDVTTNIYVNDVLVASNTSNWAKGVASADFILE